jgi:hypothetical protein
MVALRTRCGQQGHLSLALKLGKQRLIIRLPVHDDRRDHAAQMAVSRHSRLRCMRHPAERAMPVDPPITVAFAPCRVLIQATQPLWDEPLCSVLGVPV